MAQVVRYWTRVHVEVREPRWLSDVRPVKFRRFDDRTKHSQGAVELEWDLGEKVVRLLLSCSDLKALGATSDLRNDRMQLENPKTTRKLSTTPGGHNEVDLLKRTREVAGGWDHSIRYLGVPSRFSTKDRSTLQVFLRATGGSPEASLLVSELLSGQRLQGEMERHGVQLGMCLSRPSSGDFVGQRAICALQEHEEKDRPLCIVMSPTHSRLLDLLVEIVTGQLQIGRHFVCITPTNSSLEYNRSLKAPRSIRGIRTVVADGCAFGCVMMEYVVAAGWQFVRTLPQLARKMFFFDP